jgi:protein-L-isoaspartate(D-aspartate) O-methyltransferase
MTYDSYSLAGKRAQLVKTLSDKGISKIEVLNAINSIPRHLFIDKSIENHAYIDKALRIEKGQTISQPYTVAFQTELLDLKPNEKVLEVGTGSGYQAAILAKIGANVYTIERHFELHKSAKLLLTELNLKVKTFYGDGFIGLPSFAPFNKIIITAGAPEIPYLLLKQLVVGGIMVVPIDKAGSQEMLRIIKIGGNDFESKSFGKFNFVPMLSGKE